MIARVLIPVVVGALVIATVELGRTWQDQLGYSAYLSAFATVAVCSGVTLMGLLVALLVYLFYRKQRENRKP